jgi:hypothetical protein
LLERGVPEACAAVVARERREEDLRWKREERREREQLLV